MRYCFLILIFFLAYGTGLGQIGLAENYLDQGEYAKAESLYKKLFSENKTNGNFLKGLVSALQEQEKFEEAGNALQEFYKQVPQYPGINVEIGYNYDLQKEPVKAQKHYEKAISRVKEKPNNAYKIGQDFQDYNLLEQAIDVYQLALENETNPTYIIRLAKLYGEQGDLDKMFSSLLDLILEDMEYYYTVNRNFSEYVTSDPENEANKVLRNSLLKRTQETPELLYNEILSWLYVQENDFSKAFVQAKAVFQRSEDENLDPIIQLAKTAAEREFFEEAGDILTYTIEKSQTEEQKINAHTELMNVKTKHALPEDYNKIADEFEAILDEYGTELNSLQLQLLYADFLAFKLGRTTEGKSILSKLLENDLNSTQEAEVKMQLADILVAEENFNQALIYYSQIKNLAKNSPMAQEALFKVAQTSYYKGDFDWAQTQLKILKKSTSELTANDALALNLLIEDNLGLDSTQTALKMFAKADLLQMQEKNEEALSLLNQILTDHKGEKIEDEAFFRSAKVYEKLADYKKAEAYYKKVITHYGGGILADDAHYYLAELYRTKLDDSEQAMEHYKKLIFDHPDSIFFVEARKKFRKLRGDDIQ